jgi:hypothetical protein
MKVRNGVEKYLLRCCLERSNRLPVDVARQAKRAIPSPKGESLRRQVRETASLLLAPDSLCGPYLDRQRLTEFLTRAGAYRRIDPVILYRVSFTLLTLEHVHRVFADNSRAAAG